MRTVEFETGITTDSDSCRHLPGTVRFSITEAQARFLFEQQEVAKANGITEIRLSADTSEWPEHDNEEFDPIDPGRITRVESREIVAIYAATTGTLLNVCAVALDKHSETSGCSEAISPAQMAAVFDPDSEMDCTPWSVVYRAAGCSEFLPLGVFRCYAPDSDTAERQCQRAHPECDVLWVVDTNDDEQALAAWHNAA